VNAATHVIDPWPPYVGNRHIPGNGERMANAVRRYRDVSKLPCAPPPMAPVQIEIKGFTGVALAAAPAAVAVAAIAAVAAAAAAPAAAAAALPLPQRRRRHAMTMRSSTQRRGKDQAG